MPATPDAVACCARPALAFRRWQGGQRGRRHDLGARMRQNASRDRWTFERTECNCADHAAPPHPGA
ncbi:MAG: hypothetical protein IPH72_27005 [Sandaracinaceae bacterium]|nr:hypothetical protein [Sandaracinaceae bacterium]